MNESLIKGDLVEIQCLKDFQQRGFYCSLPYSGSCRYDLVVDIDGQLLRIQCKSAAENTEEGVLKINCTRSTTNTQKTIRYKYTKDEIDYFYTSWNNYGFLIPVNEVSTVKHLRIKEPKKGVTENMSIAYDYLIDNVLLSIQNKTQIKKYYYNRFVSKDEMNNYKEWSWDELTSQFSERQIRYIKEKIVKKEKAYNLFWQYKEFPEL